MYMNSYDLKQLINHDAIEPDIKHFISRYIDLTESRY